ncbi:uncharacterized protein LOC110456978 [Mizuhopecten yessoensis]|uniref:C2H2-type domain-containing protein n=1 Tax=Mizuhopecten yessoensis TaxID=6573 RepID=A0A210Q9T7_MIZYE|nr:uncharacterized protein LOC110456978 [Mizuhopecten yessoensis]OWF45496.1 hypothetical protein KP79_PYT24160 [Mizuhopecten yessoensis]
MLATEMETTSHLGFEERPKRMRLDPRCKHYDANGVSHRSLDIGGVIGVLSKYQDYDGGINCSICGKLYKSRVCFVKHLWEHTIYWDQFPGDKNQDRVLSIQAALILFLTLHGDAVQGGSILTHLLVTAPNEKRPDDAPTSPTPSPEKRRPRTPKKNPSSISPLKRKKSFDL